MPLKSLAQDRRSVLPSRRSAPRGRRAGAVGRTDADKAGRDPTYLVAGDNKRRLLRWKRAAISTAAAVSPRIRPNHMP